MQQFYRQLPRRVKSDRLLADNLMIDGAITASGGILVARDIPRAEAWLDLAAFETCVAELAERLR